MVPYSLTIIIFKLRIGYSYYKATQIHRYSYNNTCSSMYPLWVVQRVCIYIYIHIQLLLCVDVIHVLMLYVYIDICVYICTYMFHMQTNQQARQVSNQTYLCLIVCIYGSDRQMDPQNLLIKIEGNSMDLIVCICIYVATRFYVACVPLNQRCVQTIGPILPLTFSVCTTISLGFLMGLSHSTHRVNRRNKATSKQASGSKQTSRHKQTQTDANTQATSTQTKKQTQRHTNKH